MIELPGRLSPKSAFSLRGEGLDVLPRMKLVLFRAGFAASLAEVPPELRLEADLAYAEGKRLSVPEAVARCGPPGDFPPGCAPEGFYGSVLACAFASTLGEAVDGRIAELFSGGASLKGALLDAWASESLEAFNESAHAALLAAAEREGLRPIKMNGVERYSPGYGEVSVLANAALVAALPPGPVRASEKTGILSPRKSSVCLLAFGPAECGGLSAPTRA